MNRYDEQRYSIQMNEVTGRYRIWDGFLRAPAFDQNFWTIWGAHWKLKRSLKSRDKSIKRTRYKNSIKNGWKDV